MRLIKSGVDPDDLSQAQRIMNKLKMGDRVFGNPAEGLRQTLKHLEDELSQKEASQGKLDYMINDGELKQNIALVKAGIKGEEALAEWFERIAKYDEKLQDVIVFASMSDPDQDSGNGEYISDSDFVAVYGRHILILDAKNIRTNPEVPIYLEDDMLVSVGGVPILELHPSVWVWQNVFRKYQCDVESIHGCVVIVNNSGATVWHNAQWHSSEVKPLHISELVNFLHQWIEDKSPETDLATLVALSKMQIRTEGTSLNLSPTRKRFKI